jgi:hypothetical protein
MRPLELLDQRSTPTFGTIVSVELIAGCCCQE